MTDRNELARAAGDVSDLAARLRGEQRGAGAAIDFHAVRAASWRQGLLGGHLATRGQLDEITLADLLAIDRQKALVLANTRQFAVGLPANNVLLWGARGTGKSSLIHALLNESETADLRLIEVERPALGGLPEVMDRLAGEPFRFLVFCDDLSFEADDPSYKVLKGVLDGSIFAVATNVLIYATSNRRHLMPEFHSENLATRHTGDGEIHPGETSEEKLSLADRFGLWVSFQSFPQDSYLEVAAHWVASLASAAGVRVPFDDEARVEALRWARGRGNRSGRTANHFARHWVGQQASLR